MRKEYEEQVLQGSCDGNAPVIGLDLSRYVNEFSKKNKIARVLWGGVYWTCFRPTSRFLFKWRNFLLRCFGAKIGEGSKVYPNVEIWAPWNLELGKHTAMGPGVRCYNMDKVILGDNVTVSQYAYLCTGTHDISHPQMRLEHHPILIADMVWICANAFIHPGVNIGKGAVVSACAVITKDVEPWAVMMGNPAKCVKKRIIIEGKV